MPKTKYIVEFFDKFMDRWRVFGFQDEDVAVIVANTLKKAPPQEGICDVRLLEITHEN